jgi:hypothetical protein
MTVAIRHLARPSLGGRTTRVLTVLALVLPVPFCAALGLSLPLPATVERIAAKLVPFADSVALSTNDEQLLGAQGSIVRGPGEAATNDGGAVDPRGPLPALGPRGADTGGAAQGKTDGSTTASSNGPGVTTPAKEAHDSSAPRQNDPGSGSTSPSGSTSTPDPGSTPPKGGTGPDPPSSTPSVVETATGAAASAVEDGSNAADTAASTVTDTAAGAAGAAGDAVNGVVGPVLP